MYSGFNYYRALVISIQDYNGLKTIPDQHLFETILTFKKDGFELTFSIHTFLFLLAYGLNMCEDL